MFGFGTTLAAAKKKDPHFFDRGLTGQFDQQTGNSSVNESVTAMRKRIPGSIPVGEPGASLALRALGWGTLYAVTGCSLLFYGVWKLMAVNDVSMNPRNLQPQQTASTFLKRRLVFPSSETLVSFLFQFSNFPLSLISCYALMPCAPPHKSL